MQFREATKLDIPQMHLVRCAVKENILSNPALITETDYETFIVEYGKGWVCEMNAQIAGFAVVDLLKNNIWALFIHPHYEKQGIGRKLHHIMLDWYFSQTQTSVWLSTGNKTRAKDFYKKLGWQETGSYGTNEIKFEMSYENWLEQAHIKKT
ncbi:MAG: GNAT family N-acetyltransferase [Raineya sp.]|jgi:GNAT superfamily N-acetyltransferase|nr:GNAT family N-acetyltransferase [Raineya sp.]